MHAGQAHGGGPPQRAAGARPWLLYGDCTHRGAMAGAGGVAPAVCPIGRAGNAFAGGRRRWRRSAGAGCRGRLPAPALAADIIGWKPEPVWKNVFKIATLRQRGEHRPVTRRWLPAPARAKRRRAVIEARALTRDFAEVPRGDCGGLRVQPGRTFWPGGAKRRRQNPGDARHPARPAAAWAGWPGWTCAAPGAPSKNASAICRRRFPCIWTLTVGENIRLYAGIYGLNRGAPGAAGLDCGHGQPAASKTPWPPACQSACASRLALGCALVHQPQVLFWTNPPRGGPTRPPPVLGCFTHPGPPRRRRGAC